MILTRTICEIKGTGDVFCPVCGERLYHYDSRKRKAINLNGEKEVFLLRRLRCTNCHKIHLELPDFLIPCKRYFKEIIVDLLNGEDNPVPYDSSVRIVDKSGCISYSGKKWEVGPDLIGFKVGIDYTHSSPDEIIVRHGSTEPRTAHPLEIREHVTRKLTVKPKALVTPHNSRMHEAMKKKPQKTRNMAINFSGMKKDGENI